MGKVKRMLLGTQCVQVISEEKKEVEERGRKGFSRSVVLN